MLTSKSEFKHTLKMQQLTGKQVIYIGTITKQNENPTTTQSRRTYWCYEMQEKD